MCLSCYLLLAITTLKVINLAQVPTSLSSFFHVPANHFHVIMDALRSVLVAKFNLSSKTIGASKTNESNGVAQWSTEKINQWRDDKIRETLEIIRLVPSADNAITRTFETKQFAKMTRTDNEFWAEGLIPRSWKNKKTKLLSQTNKNQVVRPPTRSVHGQNKYYI